MKILMPFSLTGIGGVRTFAQKFKVGMEAAGHQVVFDLDGDYDVLFLVVQCPLKYLIHAKRHGKKVVQRLDGTFNWAAVSWKFPLLNAKATYIRHLFTDYTIYQSEFSRKSANLFLGPKINDRSSLIYNGVDVIRFSPNGKKKTDLRDNSSQKIFFTASAFRRPDQILPILTALDVYRERYDDNYKFVVAGIFSGPVAHVPELLAKRRDTLFVGPIKNEELPEYERSADVFLFTHVNPPCPNNVIEAMACGLPICGIADGAMPELVQAGENGELLPVKGSGFWYPRTIDFEAFAANLYGIVSDRNMYSQKSRVRAEAYFSLSTMVHNYSKVIEEMIK